MQCPKCESLETKVTDSRLTEKNKVIRRRRECEKCGNRYTTFERIELTKFMVIKKDGSKEPYSREKVENGLWQACHKCSLTQDQMNGLIADLEEQWTSSNVKEISSKQIGEDIMAMLKNLDHVAYIRFASVYKEFHDIDEFKDAISRLRGKK